MKRKDNHDVKKSVLSCEEQKKEICCPNQFGQQIIVVAKVVEGDFSKSCYFSQFFC